MFGGLGSIIVDQPFSTSRRLPVRMRTSVRSRFESAISASCSRLKMARSFAVRPSRFLAWMNASTESAETLDGNATFALMYLSSAVAAYE